VKRTPFSAKNISLI